MLKPTCAGPRPYRTPCSHSAVSTEVSSQRMTTGGTGEGDVTKGPGKVTPGVRIFGLAGAPNTAPSRSVDGIPNSRPTLSHAECWEWTSWVARACAWRKRS